MQTKKGTLILIITFILFMPSVLSVSVDSVLTLYYDYYGWIDLALYTLIFVGIIQELMNYRFKKGIFAGIGGGELGSGAKAVSIGLGLALAISLVTWEVKSGFYLFQIGPFILIIFILLAILSLIGWLKSKNLGLLKKFLFILMVLMVIIYFFFPSLITNYLPWSWTRSLFGVLIIIIFIILLIMLSKGGEESKKEGGKPGNKWGRFWDWNKERTQGKRAYKIEREKLAQQEKERKQKEEEKKEIEKKINKSKKDFKVFIITIPPLSHGKGLLKISPEYIRGGLRTFYVRAGSPLSLFAKIEGGSGNFRIDWSCIPSVPFGTEDNNTVAIIPTQELQTLRDQDLIKMGKIGRTTSKINWALSRGNGVYEWMVYVNDKDFKIKAYDKIRIIVMRNIDLEKKQEEELTKSEKAELKLNIDSASYDNKEYSSWRTYLLPLEKKVTFTCKKEGNFEKIRWVIKKNKKDKGKTIGEDNETLDYIFSKDEFKNGEYILEVEGYYKDSKKPDKISKRAIYLKDNTEFDVGIIDLSNKKTEIIEPRTNNKYEIILEENKFYNLNINLKDNEENKILGNKIIEYDIEPERGGYTKGEPKKGQIIISNIKPEYIEPEYKISLRLKNKFDFPETIKLDVRFGSFKSAKGQPTPSIESKEGKKTPIRAEKKPIISIIAYDKNKSDNQISVPPDTGKLVVDKDSEVIISPNYTKMGQRVLPKDYELVWHVETGRRSIFEILTIFRNVNIKNLTIKKFDENKSYNILIGSKAVQDIVVFCNLFHKRKMEGTEKYENEFVSSARVEISFKNLEFQKRYNSFEVIYKRDIKEKLNSISAKFKDEYGEIDDLYKKLNELLAIYEKSIERDRKTLIQESYSSYFLDKLKKINEREIFILENFVKLKENLKNIRKEFSGEGKFEELVEENISLCNEIIKEIGPEKFDIKRDISIIIKDLNRMRLILAEKGESWKESREATERWINQYNLYIVDLEKTARI